jgi:hypothetical protein
MSASTSSTGSSIADLSSSNVVVVDVDNNKQPSEAERVLVQHSNHWGVLFAMCIGLHETNDDDGTRKPLLADKEQLEVEVEDMKLVSRKLVLDEQERQNAQGVYNPDAIALPYAAVAKSRQTTARARGEMDEAVAMYLIRQQVQQLKQEAAQRKTQKSSPSKEQLEMKREMQQKAKLGEVENCQNRAKLLLARRREHMRKVAGSAA